MSIITADDFNIYLKSSVPTKPLVKLLFTLFNLGILSALFWLAISMQQEKPTPLIFLLPIGYLLSFGKYLSWNIFGIEHVIISSTHVSYQHNYGLWKSKFKTERYHFLEASPIDETVAKGDVKLLFGSYQEKTKLPEILFQTSIPIKFEDYLFLLNRMDEIQLDEFSATNGFPRIYNN